MVKIITPQEIKEICDSHFNMDIAKRKKTQDLVFSRFIYMKLCKKFTPLETWGAIAEPIHRRHGTVMHGVSEVEFVLSQYKTWRRHYLSLERQISDNMTLSQIQRKNAIELALYYRQKLRSLTECQCNYEQVIE